MRRDDDNKTELAFALPVFVPEQNALDQTDFLIMQPVCRFEPAMAVRRLGRREREALAIDLSGDKLCSAVYAIPEGTLHKREERVLRAKGGFDPRVWMDDLADFRIRNDRIRQRRRARI